jgi:hypothetical protein
MNKMVIVGISYVLVVLMLLSGIYGLPFSNVDSIGGHLARLVLIVSMGFSACVLLLSWPLLQIKE